MNCVDCQHIDVERTGLPQRAVSCKRLDGSIRCVRCAAVVLLTDWQLHGRKLGCPRCGTTQDMPTETDPRIGFICRVRLPVSQIDPPSWCDGYQPRIESPPPSPPVRRKRDPQPRLF